MKTFALTFAYNENFFLPRWVAYYGAQLGVENLFVLDHGSSDLSCLGLGAANILSVPRSAYDEIKRVDFASHMHRALLNYYDAGFVMDADEFVIADPRKYRSLADFVDRTSAEALTAIGLELYHVRAVEHEFVDSLPILFQRRHVIFDSWMCKRSFARIPMQFGGGFHTSNQPTVFDPDLYLIHLKNFNFNHRVLRQATTAKWTYAGSFGTHAKRGTESVGAVFETVDSLVATHQVSAAFDFREEIELCLGRTVVNPSGEFDFNLNGGFQGATVHLVPPEFRDLF
jgi:hypothetical protein